MIPEGIPRRPADGGPTTPPGPLESTVLEAVDRACAEFVASWRRGRPIRIEAFLPGHEELAGDDRALLELLDCELVLRAERGDRPELGPYLASYPHLGGEIRRLFELLELLGDGPTPGPAGRDGEPTVGGGPTGRGGARPEVPGFVIGDELGRGGMGVVYLARQVGLGRDVALKMISASGQVGPDVAARFRAEAEAIARLHHPQVVQIFAVGEHAGRPYFAMEYVPGGSLAARLDGTPWAPGRASDLVEAVARGIEEAHRLGVVHRDLKPGNILIGRDGTPKIADFGLAKLVDSDSELTRAGAVIGSPSYMAPEQADDIGWPVGPPADIHALGAMLYELVTGRPPYRGATVMATIEQVRRSEPASPSRLVPGLSRDLETVILKCLARVPTSRYGSAADLAEDLRLYRSGSPIRARRAGAFERSWRRARRNPVITALAMAVLTAVTVGFGLTFWKWREAEAQSARADASSREARRLAADLTFDRARGLFDRGEATAGRHWLGRALQAAEATPEARRPARLSLLAYEEASPRLAQVIVPPRKARTFAISGDGTTIHALDIDQVTLRHFSVTSGEPVGEVVKLDGPCNTDRDAPDFHDGGRALWRTYGERAACQLVDPSTGAVRFEHVAAKGAPPAQSRFSPDESAAVVLVGDATALVIETSSGRTIGRVSAPELASPSAFALSRGGRTLVTLGEGGGRFWDVASGRLVASAPAMPAREARVEFDHDDTLMTWERGSSGPRNRRDQGIIRFWGISGSPRFAAGGIVKWMPRELGSQFSPDGATLLIIDHIGRIGLYDAHTGRPISDRLATGGFVYRFAWSPDGATVVTGSDDGRVQFWETRTGRARGPALVHSGWIGTIQFSSDGRDLGVHSGDGSISLWRLPDRPVPADLGPELALIESNLAEPAQFAPGGGTALIASPGLGHARILSTADGRSVGPPLPMEFSGGHLLAVSPDGRRWATSSNDVSVASEIRLWDAGGRPIGGPLPHLNWIMALAFSPDGRTLAAAGYAGQVWLFDAETGQSRGASLPVRRVVMALAFSPDGRTLAVGTGPSIPEGRSIQLQLWDVAGGRLRSEADLNDWVTGVGFSPDGRSLVTRVAHNISRSTYGEFRIWDVATFRPRGEPLSCTSPHPPTIAFSPGGGLLTVGPGGVWEWDVAAGRAARLVIPLSHGLRALATDGAGRWIVTLTDDGLGQIHDAPTFRPVGPPIRAERPLIGIHLADSGRRVVAAVKGIGVRSWRLPGPEVATPGDHDPDALAVDTGTILDPATGSVTPMPAADWRRLNAARRGAAPTRSPGDAERWLALQADSAEAERNDAAALWHLERLEPLRPDDWTVAARRAGALAGLGRRDEADAAIDRAARVATAGELQDWELGRAVVAREADRPAQAHWYLGRIIADHPDDARAYMERSRVHDAAGEAALGDADLVRAVSLGLDASIVNRLADRFARSGEWARAAEVLASLDRRVEDMPDAFSNHRAVASLMADDRAGYRDTCARNLARAARGAPGVDPNNTAYLCSIGPEGVDDFAAPIALATRSLAALPEDSKSSRHMVLNTLGAIYVRAGAFDLARARLEEGLAMVDGHGEEEDWIFLALAAAGRGDQDTARRWLGRARGRDARDDPWAAAELGLLQREARARINPPPRNLPDDVFRPDR